MTDKNHAEIIKLVREVARAGDAYYRARKELAVALGIDEIAGEVPPRLLEIITLTNPEDDNDVEESARVLVQEKASGELFEEL